MAGILDAARRLGWRAMPEIELERRDDGIAVLTLNAPDRRNALTVAMAEALTAACEEIDADAAVGAVVVRGEGGYFCAGGDRADARRRRPRPRRGCDATAA